MDTVSATELDLLTIFECQPELRDEDEPWFLNDALYAFRDGSMSGSFAIAPSSRDVRLILKMDNEVVYEFNGLDVADVLYRDENGQETLEIVINATDRISVRLKPAISVRHEHRGS